MIDLLFEWDNIKARSNFQKHEVTFEEAKTVFFDECAIDYFDEEHSVGESRYLLLGMSFQFRLLLVCYCLREKDSVIRIISARKATSSESQFYRR